MSSVQSNNIVLHYFCTYIYFVTNFCCVIFINKLLKLQSLDFTGTIFVIIWSFVNLYESLCNNIDLISAKINYFYFPCSLNDLQKAFNTIDSIASV